MSISQGSLKIYFKTAHLFIYNFFFLLSQIISVLFKQDEKPAIYTLQRIEDCSGIPEILYTYKNTTLQCKTDIFTLFSTKNEYSSFSKEDMFLIIEYMNKNYNFIRKDLE